MTGQFIKLAQDFRVSWDPQILEKKFSKDMSDPDAQVLGRHRVFSAPSGIPHWQIFPSGISFARNFYGNFPYECIEVVESLRKIQSIVTGGNRLLDAFAEHKITPGRVNLIRTIGGQNVEVHCDITRDICVNIGLKNSSTFRTRIGNDSDINNFYNRPTETYTMNDGDVYLISIKNAHCVEALTETPEPRYLITYNLR